jgi:hypothetical protein
MSATRTIDGVQVTKLSERQWRFSWSDAGPGHEQRQAVIAGLKAAYEKGRNTVRGEHGGEHHRRPLPAAAPAPAVAADAADAATLADLRARAAALRPITVLTRDDTPRPPDWGGGGPEPLDLHNCVRTAVSVCCPIPINRIPAVTALDRWGRVLPDDAESDDAQWRERFIAQLASLSGLVLEIADRPPKQGRYVAVVHTEQGRMHAVAMEADGTVLHDSARLAHRGGPLRATVAYVFRPRLATFDRWGRRLA